MATSSINPTTLRIMDLAAFRYCAIEMFRQGVESEEAACALADLGVSGVVNELECLLDGGLIQFFRDCQGNARRGVTVRSIRRAIVTGDEKGNYAFGLTKAGARAWTLWRRPCWMNFTRWSVDAGRYTCTGNSESVVTRVVKSVCTLADVPIVLADQQCEDTEWQEVYWRFGHLGFKVTLTVVKASRAALEDAIFAVQSAGAIFPIPELNGITVVSASPVR